MMRCRYGVTTLSGITGVRDSYFLLFGADYSHVLSWFRLARIEFLGPLDLSNAPYRGTTHLDANLWILKSVVKLKIGSVQGKQDLFKLVPAAPLAEGAYALFFGPLESDLPIVDTEIRVVADFTVGNPRANATQPLKSGNEKSGENEAFVSIVGTYNLKSMEQYPLPPLVQPGNHYHLQSDNPIEVEFDGGAAHPRKIAASENVCLYQETWAGGKEAMIILKAILNNTTVRASWFVRK